MNREKLKETALKLLYASESGDEKTADAVTNDDFHFQFMMASDSWSAEGQEVSTRLNKKDFLKQGIQAVNDITVDGMHFKVHDVVVEEPFVVVFGQSNATSKKGRKYNNTYCWRFKFSGEKISEFREYCDTNHSVQVLFE